MAQLLRAAVVYDVGGWTASAITEPLDLDGLSVIVAPNGSGKTTILAALHPILVVPMASYMDYVRVSLRGYSSLRLMPPAVGYSELATRGTKYVAAWVRVSLGLEHRSPIGYGDRVERIVGAIKSAAGERAARIIERLIDAAAAVELDARTPRLPRTYPPGALVARLRESLGALADNWEAFEPLPGAEEGLKVEEARDILDSYLSVLLIESSGSYSAAAAMLSSYLGGNAVAVRFLSEGIIDGIQVTYFHPSLATKRVRAVDVAEATWGVIAQEPILRERFTKLCAEVIEGCMGIETLKVRGVRILGVSVRFADKGIHFIPIDTLGDGQRSVILLGLTALYMNALSGPRLLAVDTPEAYTHPDLQTFMARTIIDAAKVFNIVLTTQSIEFLREILLHADLEEMLERLRLIRLRNSRKLTGETLLTTISYEKISGTEAYSLVEEGFDVRFYNTFAQSEATGGE